MKLDMAQIEHEMQVIADSGMEEILILTGESRAQSDVEYIGEACKLARKYFRMVGLDISTSAGPTTSPFFRRPMTPTSTRPCT